jgi:hypothetical protein
MKHKSIPLACLCALATSPVLHAATFSPGYVIGSGTLSPNGETLFVDNANIGGGDSDQAAGAAPGWVAQIKGLWQPYSTVSLTGFAFPSPPASTQSGTITLTFYDLGAGNNYPGLANATVLGTATAEFVVNATATSYFVNFDTPVTFTAGSTGVAVAIQNTGSLRVKINTAGTAPGVVRVNRTTGAAIGGTNPNFRISLAGTATPSAFTDTDADGIPDIYETNTGVFVSGFNTGTNPNNPDTDNDGLKDGAELSFGTDPFNRDSDRDGLLDGVETNTGTNPTNRDSDNDRLSDGYEVANGLNPVANEDFDSDSFNDGIEVLFYGSDPKSATSFPGDGVHPAPGSFTAIQDSGLPGLTAEDLPDTLVNAFINEAAAGGNDSIYASGTTNFIVHYPNAFPSPGSTVSLTGFAWPVVASANNVNGDILIQFFDPGANGIVDGIDKEVLVGTARGTLTVPGTTSVMYWNFAQPINFTSAGTGLIVKIQSTASLLIKQQNNIATGEWYTNDGRTRFGSIQTSRFSIGGTAIAAAMPKILSITRTGNTTQLTWDLNGVPSVTLQRSTDLSGFQNVSGKINTTDTSHTETSADPRAFFRLVTP